MPGGGLNARSPRPSWRALPLGVVLAAACLGVAGRADEPAAPGEGAFTAMAAGPLGRAAAVVLGELLDVRQARGLVLAQVRPVSVFKGEVDPARRLTILVRGPTGRLDPDTPNVVRGRDAVLEAEAPTVPYLEAGTTGVYVFFLRRRPDGVGFLLDAMFDASGKVGAEKVSALEGQVELSRIADPDERARRTRAFFVEAGTKGGTWTRVNAARELNHLARVRPDVFDPASLDAIDRQARRSSVPAQRTWLQRLLRELSPGPGGEAEPAPGAEAADGSILTEALARTPDPTERIRALERYLHEGGAGAAGVVLDRVTREEAAVRAWAVTALAEGGYRAAVPRIRGLYAMEGSPEVLRAIVQAVGRLGSGEDVAWLRARLANGRVFREVLFALARIRTPGALAVLGEVREKARLGSPPRDDIVALVDYLSGAAFAEVEAAAGRSVPVTGPR